MVKALIVQGGWQGHEPKGVADLLEGSLKRSGADVTVADTLDAFVNNDLAGFDLLVPIWTMGEISNEQMMPVLQAVHEQGVGIGGVHGGMCDAFRQQTEWQFMCGGQWVAHPGNDGVNYTVEMNPAEPDPITDGVSTLNICSEQYYLHVDPGNRVLASTTFGDGTVMPVVWTKNYGMGRVFYCSLGHHVDVIEPPEILTMITRGLLWAAAGNN